MYYLVSAGKECNSYADIKCNTRGGGLEFFSGILLNIKTDFERVVLTAAMIISCGLYCLF